MKISREHSLGELQLLHERAHAGGKIDVDECKLGEDCPLRGKMKEWEISEEDVELLWREKK